MLKLKKDNFVSFLKMLLSTIPFAYLLFRFYLIPFNVSAQKILLFFVLAFYILSNFGKMFTIKEKTNYFAGLAVFAFFAVLAFAVPVIKGTMDFSYGRKFVSHVLDILCWTAFAIHVKKKAKDKPAVNVFTNEFCTIMCMYVAFTVLCIAVSPLRELLPHLVEFSAKELKELTNPHYIGRISWDGFAGYNSTFYCSLGVFLCCVVLNNNLINSKKIFSKKIIVFLAVLIIGNCFYGRSGLVVSGIIILVTIVKVIITNKNYRLLFIFIGLAIGTVILLLILKRFIPAVNNLFTWIFEPLINLFEGKGLLTTSTNSLFSMYHMPPAKSLFLGDGYYTDAVNGTYYKGVDVGFLRGIYFWGIITTILSYAFTVFIFRNSPAYTKYSLIMFIVLFGLFEFKGEVYRMLIVSFIPFLLLDTSNMTDILTRINLSKPDLIFSQAISALKKRCFKPHKNAPALKQTEEQ